MRASPVALPLLVVLCVTVPVWADLPLTVEDLITDTGRIKLDLSLAYANAERQGLATGEPIVIQTGPASFITLPSAVGERRTNTDSLVTTAGLRYGLNRKAEIYVRGSYLHSNRRGSDIATTYNESDSRFADAWAGVNYQFKQDDAIPALLGFAEIALYERHRYNGAAFRSALLGLTTYKAIDPVVLSLTAAYQFNRTRKDGDANYRPGDLLLLNPSVAFAVNDRVTLTTGMQWTSRRADRFDGRNQGTRRTSTDLLLGVGYGFGKRNILNLTFRANTSGRDRADLRVNWSRTF